MWVNASGVKTAATATQAVVENPDRMEAYDAATQDALDPYIGMREAFIAYRAAAVRK
jgi:ABC-type transporter lipoprotein component MlaA